MLKISPANCNFHFLNAYGNGSNRGRAFNHFKSLPVQPATVISAASLTERRRHAYLEHIIKPAGLLPPVRG